MKNLRWFLFSKVLNNAILYPYPAFFVEKIQYAKFRFDEVNAGLVVIEINQFPLNLLLEVFLLLQLKDVLVELLLQFLVGVVDAELLERVDLERLKPVNVQNTDEAQSTSVLQLRIDLTHDPREELRVHVFGEGVSRRGRFRGRHCLYYLVSHAHNAAHTQPPTQCLSIRLRTHKNIPYLKKYHSFGNFKN